MTARLWNQRRFRLIHGQSGNRPYSDDLALAAAACGFTGTLNEREMALLGLLTGVTGTASERIRAWEEGINAKAQNIAVALGITPAVMLDAGDSASYPGSGQTWADVSGNSRSFLLGATSGASTDDSTFNGTAGGLSSAEFFSYDGGDCNVKATANDALFNGLHKDGATWSWAAEVYVPATPATGIFLSTLNGSAIGPGIEIQSAANVGKIRIYHHNGSSGQTVVTSTAVPNYSAWNFYGIGWNEAGESFLQINDTVETFTVPLTSPSASNASNVAVIGARAGSNTFLPSGTRLGAFALFGSTLTQSQMAAFKASTMARFL